MVHIQMDKGNIPSNIGLRVDGMEAIQAYYGKRLQNTSDLQTNACCTDMSIPESHKLILREIHPEILEKFYGCGSPVPDAIQGKTVLDLGCGSGRDVYLISKLVGPKGKVIGIDMTPEQLEVARRHLIHQTEIFGLQADTISFVQGFIEDLASAGIADNSVDVVISNCVINLSPDKERVFKEIFRVLKPGGELYFSDIFSGRRIPASLRDDEVLLGECLSGALYLEDFRRLMRQVGCLDYRVQTRRPLIIGNAEIEARIGMIDFYSLTIRAFKLPESLEDLCEDYGQVATYSGTLENHPHFFDLDDHHRFQTGRPMLVCGNTAAMLAETRYSLYFRVQGDRSTHFGPFDCISPVMSVDSSSRGQGACC